MSFREFLEIREISDEAREKMHKILDLCIDRTNRGKDTFFRFSSHVNQVEIDKIDGRWKEEIERETFEGYFNCYLADIHPLDELIESFEQEVDSDVDVQ